MAGMFGVRRGARHGAALCATLSVLLLLGGSGAQAGTTAASSLTKTGTDALTGATASSTGAVGTTGPGHAINWVLHYSNTTGAPASVNLKDRVGANQTFVAGSLRVPSGTCLAPEWSANGGSGWVTSEPTSGVDAVGASGTAAPGGLGTTGGFSAIATAATGSNGGGDGWDDIFYGGNAYNLHHDYITGATCARSRPDGQAQDAA